MGRIRNYFHAGNPNWTIRRRIVIASLLFCAGMTVWAAQWMRIEVAPSIISQSFTMATLVISGYIFGNIADDHLQRRANRFGDVEHRDVPTLPKQDGC